MPQHPDDIASRPSDLDVRLALTVLASEFDCDACPDYDADCIDCQASRVYRLLKEMLDEGEYPTFQAKLRLLASKHWPAARP